MTSQSFNLCTLGGGLTDVVESFSWGLQQLGHTVKAHAGAVDATSINLLFAAHGVPYAEVLQQAPRCINFNVEPAGSGSGPNLAMGAGYFALMRNIPTWDYSRGNALLLQTRGVSDASHVPLGYAASMERVAAVDPDIDVLFYGTLNARRLEVLKAIEALGLKVVATTAGFWTPEQRDQYLARSKVVLNVGYYDDIHVLEEPRIGYLLANRIAVVSEMRPETIAEDDMRQSVAGAALQDLPALCVQLCGSAAKRRDLSDQGYQRFRARPWLGTLDQAVDQYVRQNPAQSRAIKRDITPPCRLNIGSGKSWKSDHFNIDIDPERGADLVFDLNGQYPFEQNFLTWRFGQIRLPKGHFDYILSEHVFEHVRNLVQCMTTCLDWLKDGGILEIEVPYDLSFGAWQDPTHVRAFNERSWLYYTEWCWYTGWRDHRFDLISQVHILSELGQQMVAKGDAVDLVARTPRAVDALRVKLQKRALRDDEKAAHQTFFRKVT